MASLLDRRPMDLRDGTQFWDFMHVSDVAAAFLSLLRSDVQGLVNIGGGKAGPQREVMDGLTQRLGGGDLINIGGRPRGTGEPSNIGADATRLIEEVGFRPVYGGKTRFDDRVAWARLQNQALPAAS